ncbi:hypothetical protein H2201_000438 [Coniosporium apollinis]|uniref:AA9 family lytic polysaccharide monooxygenase n=1 Tax=Coniosporium apollinis TaxID=61459 RepID=A0ABQ9P4P9_9PEZI|nr:hypothetical protein H2201_000438 [Coniosporium apollinis]
MKFSKSQAVAAALVAANAANAHTIFSNFYVDGLDQGDATCVRMSNNPSQATFPIAGITSEDMACGVNGKNGVARVCKANSDSTLTFEFRAWANDASKGMLDISHKGPCAMYLKKVSSAIDDSATGDGWFKIWDEGYNEDKKQWCTERLITEENGRLSIKLPAGLQGGYYLARPELLALHAADKGDPQFYTGCAQIYLESSGTKVPAETVSIPGHVQYGQKAVSFNIWRWPGMDLPYPNPGPSVATLVDGSSSASVSSGQIEGQRPADCIMENGNWCGKEVPSYSTQDGCWKAGQNCWDQADVCWKSAPPTGGKGCDLWGKYCESLNNQCRNKNWNGPPNAGKDMTPKHTTIQLGGVVGTRAASTAAANPAPVASASATSAAEAPAYTSEAAASSEPTSAAASSPAYTYVAPSSKAASSAAAPTSTSLSFSTIVPEAPATTENPWARWETVVETVVVTEVEYVTQYHKRHARHFGQKY